eukprot:TRINITY_DN58544_c0_g1_i1.p1 TRINITY_DN58544_c0_g1~~TRINITY_DN58544_c0_g1_i1.p1  ORF type:complete len:468 (+),score=166.12 TRINITY_DN58544_c0_g1_i1:197-1600(+)
MLLKVVGDEDVIPSSTGPLNWNVSVDLPLNNKRQITDLMSQLGLAGRGIFGGLPNGFHLHRGIGRSEYGEELDESEDPRYNNLHGNDFIYIRYSGNTSSAGTPAGGQEAWDDRGHPRPSALPQAGSHAFGSRKNFADSQAQQTRLDAMAKRLQEVEEENSGLRRQVLQLADEVRARNQTPAPHAYAQYSATPASHTPSYSVTPVRQSRQGSPVRSGSVDGRENPTASSLPDTDAVRQLQEMLAATRAELREKSLKLETLEAWKAQHDCSVSQKKASDLRTDISDMRNTLRGVASERERVKEELQQKRRALDEAYQVQTQSGTALVKEAGSGSGVGSRHLMPMPYYLDPYKAPASTYANNQAEGTVCKLRVQTLSGDGSVVRRMYTSLTRDGMHAILLASLEGVVTDEIAASDLVKAGVGYNRPNLLFLATAKHKWVLELEAKDRSKWLDWLLQTNPSLAAQQTSPSI